MTWDELKEKAKELGADVKSFTIFYKNLCFDCLGVVRTIGIEDIVLENKRTYEQMLMIMEALK